MAKADLPSPDELRQLLSYDPGSGKLFWKERPLHLFSGDRAEREHKRWNGRHAGQEAFTTRNREGYPQGCVYKVTVAAHRVVWCLVHGEWPALSVDHINGDKADNRIGNLRVCEHRENCRNRGSNRRWRGRSTKSAFCGVSLLPQGWIAYIGSNGRRIHIGTYPTEEEAARAYDAAAIEHHGEFARLNFPS